MNKSILQEAIYGSEAIEAYYDTEMGKHKHQEILLKNGIWSQPIYTNIDAVFFFEAGTDFLKSEFKPFIFPNHHNTDKLKSIPEPFNSMSSHYPPTMLGQKIFNFD